MASNPQWVGGRGQEAGLDLLLGLSADQAQKNLSAELSSTSSTARGGKQVQISKHFGGQSIIRLQTCTYYITQIFTMLQFHEHEKEDTESEERGHKANTSQGMYVQNSIFAK